MEELKLIKLRDDIYLLEIGGREVMKVEYGRTQPPRSFSIELNHNFLFSINSLGREEEER